MASTTYTSADFRTAPHDLEAEQAVLGAMLIDAEAVAVGAELLDAGAFYEPKHAKIYAAILALYDEGTPVDMLTVTDTLRKSRAGGASDATHLDDVGGPSYLAELTKIVPTAANIRQYCRIVKQKFILRALITSTNRIQKEAYDGEKEPDHLVDEAESEIFKIASHRIKREAVQVKDVIKSSVELIDKLYQRKGAITGLPTGYKDLDEQMAGLQPADFIVVAGRPSMGKSSFAFCVAENVALGQNVGVGVFSLEMSKENLVQRMLCSHARINAHNVRTGMLSASDWPALTKAAGKLSEAPIFIDDQPGATVLELRSKARRMKSRHNIGLVIVDYMQLMEDSASSENRVQEISSISRGIKALARELSIPVIAVSQLSRAPERELRRPRLSDLRESGAIEQDADVVLMLYREEYYADKQTEENKGIAEVIIAKQRNGPTGTVKLAFIKEYTRFETLATA